MDAPVTLKGLLGTETLWFAGERCRKCAQPATHYWLRQVSPEKWGETGMTFLATPYCVPCSPVVEDFEKANYRPAAQPWWKRLLRTAAI